MWTQTLFVVPSSALNSHTKFHGTWSSISKPETEDRQTGAHADTHTHTHTHTHTCTHTCMHTHKHTHTHTHTH
jgi:hypothetical protein